jgi:hypothetical protein
LAFLTSKITPLKFPGDKNMGGGRGHKTTPKKSIIRALPFVLGAGAGRRRQNKKSKAGVKQEKVW